MGIDIFYFVGHDESKLIIETVSSDGKLLDTQSNELGFTPNSLIETQVNFDQILYMYDDNICGAIVIKILTITFHII